MNSLGAFGSGRLRGTCSSCALGRHPFLATRRRHPLPRASPTTTRLYSQNSQQRPRFSARLRAALNNSKVQWYQLPIGVAIGFVGLMHIYKTTTGEQEKEKHELDELRDDDSRRPKRRERIRPDGPWQVQVMSTLPLKAISRLWGRFNELDIPYYLRVPGFKLYSWIFGVNLDEVAEPDLHVYPNLASFFYRTLKPGARPLDPNPQALLSPSDGCILQFGQIEGGDIEQVKGMTYSIDALLGKHTPPSSVMSGFAPHDAQQHPHTDRYMAANEDLVKTDEEFARVNGISYTLPDLLTGGRPPTSKSSFSSWWPSSLKPKSKQNPEDSTPLDTLAATTARPPRDESADAASPSAVSAVTADLALGDRKPWHALLDPASNRRTLYYAVVYLAPGDYHRFHSPANWVVERRRHFAGELYSVSPYLQRTLPGLFTLNERVVLLGRWRWGFFAYVPVGATNVGSIKVNFDRELRTNSLTTDTLADQAAEEAAKRGEPHLGFSEAMYGGASAVLGGRALRKGEEMGGFRLGSTVVLVFEAPVEEGTGGAGHKGGWRWNVEKGQTVKMGQALGYVDEE